MKPLKFLIIVGISFIFLSCGKDEEVSSVESNGKTPQLVIDKFSVTTTNAGKVEWIFRAQRALVFENENLIDADGINVDFFFDKNQKEISSHLNAKTGNVNTKTNDMKAEGNVVLTAENGNKLFTERLEWRSAEQKFFTDKEVKVEKKDSILTGVGMEADTNLENIRILKDVKVEARE